MLIFHMFFYCIYVKNYQIIFDRVEQQILIRKKLAIALIIEDLCLLKSFLENN